MWSLFFWLLLSWFLGLTLIYGVKYFKDPEEFDGWYETGQALVRIFAGALLCLIIALASQWPWLIYVLPGVAAILSNYWMPWLIKKIR